MATGVSSNRISAVVGYVLTKGDFRLSSPNLPQQIELFGEANAANQASLDTTRWLVTNLTDAGNKYGFGSPIYTALRILFPRFGAGVQGIPVYVDAQAQAVGATAAVWTVTPSGTATANATHTIMIAGRDNVDGQSYNFTVATGDTPAIINTKITAAVISVVGSQMLPANYGYNTQLTSKWNGLTANDVTVVVTTGNNAAGITYGVVQTQLGAGTPVIATGLSNIGFNWSTIGINGYGLNATIMSTLEAWNGAPDPINPTGRYVGTTMKPMIWFSGSVLDDPSSITDPRNSQLTIAVSPAPNSPGMPIEAAANHALITALCAQNSPNIDILNVAYPDMPVPLTQNIGSMADYNNRDRIVQLGCSTVDFRAGVYIIKDSVTTYHPAGEIPPQYRYVSDLFKDFNVRYGYLILETANVVGKQIANDADTVSAVGTTLVKPKSWKQLLGGYFDDLVNRGIIVDAPFSKTSLAVSIDPTNPNRFNTSFRVKRSGVARISSTVSQTGFNFGSIGS